MLDFGWKQAPFEIPVGCSGGPVWLRMPDEGEAKRVLEPEMGADA